MTRPLHPHQAEALSLLRQSLAGGHRRPMIQAPTGAGKTMLAAAIVEGALRKGNRVTFCVPALSLIDQTVAAFWNEGIRDVGVIQGAHAMTSSSRPIQVASVQTLQRRTYIPEAEIVVIDEAHRWFNFYAEWMSREDWKAIPFVGLSATPWTRGLGKYFDDLIVAATTADLIEKGLLSRFRVFAPSHPDLKAVRTVAGDFHEGDLSDAMDQPELTADVVSTWLRLGEGRPTFVFAVDRAHAKNLSKQFASAGVATAYIDAYTEMDEREDIRKQFHRGEVKVVCNVGCLTTGVDWDVRCLVMARPTKSEMLFVQMIGRGLRTADGKPDCVILDHSDSHARLGFVTDIQHAKLDDGKPKTAADRPDRLAALPKECSKCSFLKPAKVHSCPCCGFAPERQSQIEIAEGELSELRTVRKPKPAEKRSFYAQLVGYAKRHGHDRKWVLANYRAKFNEWPHDRTVPAESPSPEILSWLRSRRIAWVKSVRGAEALA